MSEYKKLENQPLKFVLAEFRFSLVLTIADYIPQIQEELRKQFPISEKKSDQAIDVQSGGIAITSLERWTFLSANKKNAIEINQERLVYVTSEYPRFGGFSEACKAAIEVLIRIVEPSLITRIGLRYGDLITIEKNEKFTDIVNEHFCVPNIVKELGNPLHHTTDTYLNTNMGMLAIRTLYGNIPHNCLPDMQGLSIALHDDSTPSERLILDFDHFWESRDESVNFDTKLVMEKLSALHSTSREAFWKITSDYARNEKWA